MRQRVFYLFVEPFFSLLASESFAAETAHCKGWNTHNFMLSANSTEVADCIVSATNIDEYNSRGSTALQNASSAGNLNVVRFLLSKGASVELGTEKNSEVTALFFAADVHVTDGKGKSEVVQELVSSGAEVNAIAGPSQVTPLHIAAQRGNFEAVRILLESGASITEDAKGLTPLHWSVLRGGDNAIRTVTELLKFGSNPYALTTDGWNVLHFAARNDAFLAIQEFRSYASLTEQMNVEGQLPTQLAAQWSSPETLSALLQIGASQAVTDSDGNNLLHIAVQHGNRRIVDMLAPIGKLREQGNNLGMTPLILAAQSGSDDAIWSLLNAGADHHARDQSGRTAWDFVLENESLNNTQSYWRLHELSH